MGDIYAFDLDGNIYDNFPVAYNFPNSSSPAIFDIDQDLDLEIVGGTANSIVMIDIKTEGTSNDYWNIYKGDNQRKGYYEFCMGGDLDNSQHLNVQDIILFINIILGLTDASEFELCQIDLNVDSIVNVLDLIILVNEILDD